MIVGLVRNVKKKSCRAGHLEGQSYQEGQAETLGNELKLLPTGGLFSSLAKPQLCSEDLSGD